MIKLRRMRRIYLTIGSVLILCGVMLIFNNYDQHTKSVNELKLDDEIEAPHDEQEAYEMAKLLLDQPKHNAIQPQDLSMKHVDEDVPWLGRTSSCTNQNNVAFLKIHKCASSTVQNILMRYGDKHDLLFAFPEKSHIFPLTKPFNSSFVWTKAEFHTQKELNIFTMHCKWNKPEVKKILEDDAAYFTIVRDPMEAFLSLYDYFAFETFYKMPVEQFIAKNGIEMNRFMGCLSYNIMACDMGANPGDYIQPKRIRLLTDQMDVDFDLVMIAERFEESLVLLAHLLCWSYEDLVSINVNSRFKKKDRLSPHMKNMLYDRLKPDYYIYDYFAEKFNRLVIAFGEEKMVREVKKLRRVTDDIVTGCNITRKNPVLPANGREMAGISMVEQVLTESEDLICRNLVYPEQSFVRHLRLKQPKLLDNSKH